MSVISLIKESLCNWTGEMMVSFGREFDMEIDMFRLDKNQDLEKINELLILESKERILTFSNEENNLCFVTIISKRESSVREFFAYSYACYDPLKGSISALLLDFSSKSFKKDFNFMCSNSPEDLNLASLWDAAERIKSLNVMTAEFF